MSNSPVPFDGGYFKKVANGVMKTRGKIKAALNLGYVSESSVNDESIYRDPHLEKLDAYYDNRQYDHLIPFDQSEDAAGQFVPLRHKQPRIKLAFAKTLAARVTSKLIGPTVFPALNIEGMPDDQEYFRAIARESNLQSFLLEPTKRMLNCGEIFIRFYIAGGVFKKQWYHAKYCYPSYDEAGELEEVRIQYVYDDQNDLDPDGKPRRKWYRIDLGNVTETLFDNPLYDPKVEPEFNPVTEIAHNFGFVQGEWMTTTGEAKGYGLVCDVTDFIDELCYSLSQSSKATAYNQDPQLTLKNMTEEETAELIRSSSKGWNLGMKGEAAFVESNMNGVKVAMDLRDKMKMSIQDITRIILLDPEKIVGSAQSARAMEVLHGPLKDLVDELRMPIGGSIKKLVLKMGAANLLAGSQGMDMPIQPPAGWKLKSMDLVLKWPPIFQQTLEDLQKKVATAAQARTALLVSPRTALKFVAEDFGVEDIDQELKEIDAAAATAAALNPFGGF